MHIRALRAIPEMHLTRKKSVHTCKSANVCPNHRVQISLIEKAMAATTMTTTDNIIKTQQHNNNNKQKHRPTQIYDIREHTRTHKTINLWRWPLTPYAMAKKTINLRQWWFGYVFSSGSGDVSPLKTINLQRYWLPSMPHPKKQSICGVGGLPLRFQQRW